MRITIIGYGAYGKALSEILSFNGHDLFFYDPFVFPNISLEEAVNFGEIILFSAPSSTLYSTLKSLKSLDSKNLEKPFILASKGLPDASFTKNLAHPHILSGPAFAADLIKHLPATLTTESVYVKHLFETPFLSIEICHDLHGILLCGSLKDIYAIYAGYHHVRPATEKFRTFLMDALKEIKLILKVNDCKPSTADYACGFRDLALTASTTRSRNYSLGYALGNTTSVTSKKYLKKDAPLTEGLSALRAMLDSKDFYIPDDPDTTIPIFLETMGIIKPYLE